MNCQNRIPVEIKKDIPHLATPFVSMLFFFFWLKEQIHLIEIFRRMWYPFLKSVNHAAKNLYNEGLYSVRQHFFRTGKYLPYSRNYPLLKNSENYKTLNSNMAQQILKEVDGTFRSFFGLLRLAGEGKYAHRDISIPHYLPKDGYMTLVVGFVRLNGNRFVLPYSNSFKKTHAPITITMPPVLEDKTIKGILFWRGYHACLRGIWQPEPCTFQWEKGKTGTLPYFHRIWVQCRCKRGTEYSPQK